MSAEKDRPWLEDIRSHAVEAVSYVDGVERRDFFASPVLQRAVKRNLGVIGEAAAHVSGATRDALPEIPWDAFARFRGIETRSVDVDELWAIVLEDLPPLASVIDAFLDRVSG